MLSTAIPTLDKVLHAHRAALGGDFTAYRNHTYRVANVCAAQISAGSEQLEKIAIAAAYHDLGIWTDRTFDYLAPSIELARAHLVQSNRPHWTAEISAMIFEHHKVTPYRGHPDWLVEPFRRADWIDVSRGLRRFGLSRRFLKEIVSAWPDAGFHKRLVQLSLARLRSHPWSPLPMVRL